MKTLEERKADRATRAVRNAEIEGGTPTAEALQQSANGGEGGIAADPTAAEKNGGGDGSLQNNTAINSWSNNA